jgi:hypothetical protein
MSDTKLCEDTWLLAQEKGRRQEKKKDQGSWWDAAGPGFSAIMTLPVLLAH